VQKPTLVCFCERGCHTTPRHDWLGFLKLGSKMWVLSHPKEQRAGLPFSARFGESSIHPMTALSQWWQRKQRSPEDLMNLTFISHGIFPYCHMYYFP
jgi:hypothetical protein